MPTEVEVIGRIVWGHPAKAQVKKDQKTKAPIIGKDGQPVQQWVFGLAVERPRFENDVWPQMARETATGYPQGAPGNFSYKYKDGNTGVDRNGKPYNQREGYANHYVLTISTEAFAPPIYKWDGRQYVQMEANQIKCGDYVSVKTDFKCNVPQDRTHTPGLFVNPKGILHIGYGTEIITTGGDPTEMFGAQPQNYALPAGASTTPLAPNTGNAGMPGSMPPNGQPGAPGQMPPGQMPPNGQQGYQPPPQQGYQPPPQQGYQPPPQQGYQPPPQQGYQPPPQQGYQPPPQQGYQPPPQQGYQPPPNGQPGGQQPGYPQPGSYQPAPDFVHNAGQQPGYPQPGQMPGQQPGMMPGNR